MKNSKLGGMTNPEKPRHSSARRLIATVLLLAMLIALAPAIPLFPDAQAAGTIPGVTGFGTMYDPYLITSQYDLYMTLMMCSPDSYIMMRYGITIDSSWVSPHFAGIFTGNFDGNGCVIDVSDSTSVKVRPLFEQLGSGATIKDLTYTTRTTYIQPSTPASHGDSFWGAIAGIAMGGSIENCTFNIGIDNSAGNAHPDQTPVGGIVGAIYPGSSTANITIKDCNVTINGRGNIYVTAVPFAEHMGGIVGEIDSRHMQDRKMVEIAGCYVMLGDFLGKRNVGGIAGHISDANSPNPSFVDIHNNIVMGRDGYYPSGDYAISGNTAVGGIAGRMNSGGVIRDNAILEGRSPGFYAANTEAGGIVGLFDKGTIENCYTTFGVRAASGVAGGIAGYVDSSAAVIRNCAAMNTSVTGLSVGRIAGTNLGTYTNNYSTDIILSSTDTHTGQNGQVRPRLRFLDDSFWTGDLAWSASNWVFRGADKILPLPRSSRSDGGWNDPTLSHHLVEGLDQRQAMVEGYRLEITPVTAPYNGNPIALPSAFFDPASAPESAGMTYSYRIRPLGTPNYLDTPPSDAGTYEVQVTYGNTYYNGTQFRNFTIQKAAINPNNPTFYVKENLPRLYTYDLAQLLPGGLVRPGNISYQVTGVYDPDGLLINGAGLLNQSFAGSLTLDVDNIPFIAAGATQAKITFAITSDNYTFTDAVLTVEVSDLDPIQILGPYINSRDYDKTPLEFGGGLVLKDENDVELYFGTDISQGEFLITYEGTTAEGVHYFSQSDDGTPPTGPVETGDYTLIFETTASSFMGKLAFNFAIYPKTVTVRASSHEINMGDPLPAPSYTVAGFVGSDGDTAFAVMPAARLTVSDSSVPAQSAVEFSPMGVLNNSNYRLEHINGTLNILPGTEIPSFQLLYLTPTTLYSKDEQKVLSLTGAGLDKATDIILTGPGISSTYTLTPADKAAVSMSIDNRQIAIDLVALQTTSSINFETTGVYSVKLSDAGAGYATRSFTFTISDNVMYSRSGYGVLRIVQGSSNAFRIEVFENESDMPKLSGSDKSLIIVRGQIKEDKLTGVYTVGNDSFINKALSYDIAGKTPMTIEKLANGSIAIDGPGNLKWQGVTIVSGGFRINLDPKVSYASKRVDTASVGIPVVPAANINFNYYTLQVKDFGIKLFEDSISVAGALYVGSSMPAFLDNVGGASFTMHEMILSGQRSSTLPPMYFTAKVGVNEEGPIGSLISDSGFNLELNINSLPETIPNYLGVKGNVSVAGAFYMRGEFILMWENGIFIPEKIELFGRVEEYGIPLVPLLFQLRWKTVWNPI